VHRLENGGMKVLITGGCGFVGTNLVKYLVGRNCTVRILDNLLTASQVWLDDEWHNLPPFSTVELVTGDFREGDSLSQAFEGIDAVVHLAAHTSVVESLENPWECWDLNVTAMLTLLETCRHKGVKRFVFASSNAVAGDQTPPIDENIIPLPLSPYGASKLAGEALCSAYHHSYGMETVSLRFANLYGPCADHKSSVVSIFLKLIREGEPLFIYGDGDQTRDFVHVEDVCKAVHLVLTAEAESFSNGGLFGEILQIASGTETSVNRLVELLSEVTGRNIEVIRKPERAGEIRRNYSDISKAKRVLGYNPDIDLRRGLEDLWNQAS